MKILVSDPLSLEAIPEGHMVFIQNQDSPGVIGRIATTLGNHNINISHMQRDSLDDQFRC